MIDCNLRTAPGLMAREHDYPRVAANAANPVLEPLGLEGLLISTSPAPSEMTSGAKLGPRPSVGGL